MNKPQGYDEAQAFTGDFENLPAGAYICTIQGAKLDETSTKRECLVLALDISEGEYTGYFKKRFDADSRSDRKWPGTFRQITDGTSTPFFKGMITSIELSNTGYKWDFDETKLKGKKVGALFGREQYVNGSGELKWATKCQALRSVEAVKKGIEPPADKYLAQAAGSTAPINSSYAQINVEEEELPF